MDPALQETIDWVALRRLQDAYADIVTRREWAELADVFRADTRIVVDTRAGRHEFVGPGPFGDFVRDSIEKFEFFEFVIRNTRLYIGEDGDPDAARGRMFMSELRQEQASGRWTTIHGVYHDHFRRVDGRWWFASRHYSSLARPAGDVEVFPYPSPEPY